MWSQNHSLEICTGVICHRQIFDCNSKLTNLRMSRDFETNKKSFQDFPMCFSFSPLLAKLNFFLKKMPLLMDVPENKSAFVQKIKGKEAISSPREVGHTLTTRQNCPLFAMSALNLQEVSSSRRSLRETCLNEALGTGTCSFMEAPSFTDGCCLCPTQESK